MLVNCMCRAWKWFGCLDIVCMCVVYHALFTGVCRKFEPLLVENIIFGCEFTNRHTFKCGRYLAEGGVWAKCWSVCARLLPKHICYPSPVFSEMVACMDPTSPAADSYGLCIFLSSMTLAPWHGKWCGMLATRHFPLSWMKIVDGSGIRSRGSPERTISCCDSFWPLSQPLSQTLVLQPNL